MQITGTQRRQEKKWKSADKVKRTSNKLEKREQKNQRGEQITEPQMKDRKDVKNKGTKKKGDGEDE